MLPWRAICAALPLMLTVVACRQESEKPAAAGQGNSESTPAVSTEPAGDSGSRAPTAAGSEESKTESPANTPTPKAPESEFAGIQTAEGEQWNAIAKSLAASGKLAGNSTDEAVAILGPAYRYLHRLIYAFPTVEGSHDRTPEMLVNLSVEGRLEDVGYVGYLKNVQSAPFSEEKWSTGGELARFHMAIDLSNRNPLKGKTREEVLQILGEPTREIGPAFLYYTPVRSEEGDLTPDEMGSCLRLEVEDGKVSEARFIDRS